MKSEFINLGRFQCKTLSIKNDIWKVLNSSCLSKITTFDAFNSLLISSGFNFIHYACLENSHRVIFINFLYLQSLQYSLDSYSRIASIFSLYYIYFSQPTCFDKVYIRIKPDSFKSLHDIALDLVHQELFEPVLAFNRLLDDKAFMFVKQDDLNNQDASYVEPIDKYFLTDALGSAVKVTAFKNSRNFDSRVIPNKYSDRLNKIFSDYEAACKQIDDEEIEVLDLNEEKLFDNEETVDSDQEDSNRLAELFPS